MSQECRLAAITGNSPTGRLSPVTKQKPDSPSATRPPMAAIGRGVPEPSVATAPLRGPPLRRVVHPPPPPPTAMFSPTAGIRGLLVGLGPVSSRISASTAPSRLRLRVSRFFVALDPSPLQTRLVSPPSPRLSVAGCSSPLVEGVHLRLRRERTSRRRSSRRMTLHAKVSALNMKRRTSQTRPRPVNAQMTTPAASDDDRIDDEPPGAKIPSSRAFATHRRSRSRVKRPAPRQTAHDSLEFLDRVRTKDPLEVFLRLAPSSTSHRLPVAGRTPRSACGDAVVGGASRPALSATTRPILQLQQPQLWM